MHTWDAVEALGRLRPMDPWLAWDGVLEVRDVIHPRKVRLGRIGPGTGAVRLAATDVHGEVTIGAGEPVEVRGSAELLWRLLWHRADTEREAIDPRAAVLLAGAVTP